MSKTKRTDLTERRQRHPIDNVPDVMTTDRARYIDIKRCAVKRKYLTLSAAEHRGQHVYWCQECKGFHRTSFPVDAATQRIVQKKAAKYAGDDSDKWAQAIMEGVRRG